VPHNSRLIPLCCTISHPYYGWPTLRGCEPQGAHVFLDFYQYVKELPSKRDEIVGLRKAWRWNAPRGRQPSYKSELNTMITLIVDNSMLVNIYFRIFQSFDISVTIHLMRTISRPCRWQIHDATMGGVQWKLWAFPQFPRAEGQSQYGTGHPPRARAGGSTHAERTGKRPKIRGKADPPIPHGAKKIGFPHGRADAIWGYYPKPEHIWYSSVLYS